jgi:hypothetical protein
VTGHVFHPGHSELHGVTVIVETLDARTYVGRYDTEDNAGVHLIDVGVHDGSVATLSKEDYIMKSVKFGVRSELRHMVVPAAQVARISRLGDGS